MRDVNFSHGASVQHRDQLNKLLGTTIGMTASVHAVIHAQQIVGYVGRITRRGMPQIFAVESFPFDSVKLALDWLSITSEIDVIEQLPADPRGKKDGVDYDHAVAFGQRFTAGHPWRGLRVYRVPDSGTFLWIALEFDKTGNLLRIMEETEPQASYAKALGEAVTALAFEPEPEFTHDSPGKMWFNLNTGTGWQFYA
jgi:hypothetical protein